MVAWLEKEGGIIKAGQTRREEGKKRTLDALLEDVLKAAGEEEIIPVKLDLERDVHEGFSVFLAHKESGDGADRQPMRILAKRGDPDLIKVVAEAVEQDWKKKEEDERRAIWHLNRFALKQAKWIEKEGDIRAVPGGGCCRSIPVVGTGHPGQVF